MGCAKVACLLEHRTTLANGNPTRRENRVGMTFAELRAAIDDRLAAEPRLQGSRRQLEGERSVWTRDREIVAIAPSGTTGILVELSTNGRVVRSKIFAASPMSVERIVTTSAEHLTSYVFHRTS
jgi:hypothetical protein